jgi:hypothetical protein
MRRLGPYLLGLGCLGLLGSACFGPVLGQGRQFGYRDAGQFYYPLYLRVQQEWGAGRLPLWDPSENAGTPLLGCPTAAVLYPGKLVFALVPFAWGMRLYVVGHTLLATLAMYAFARALGVGRVGSGLGALGYGFGAPVLFQHCNVIFLVGAAWAPLGLRAADGWVRSGRRWSLVELAAILALQVLGGDPQSAYLVGFCAAAYAVGLGPWGRSAWRPTALGAAACWAAAVLVAAAVLPACRPRGSAGEPAGLLPWTPYVPRAAAVAWAAAGLGLLAARGRARPVVGRLVGLGAAGAVAAALTGTQLLPVLEYSALSTRADAEAPHALYGFSVEPVRLVGLAWPNVLGDFGRGSQAWVEGLPSLRSPTPWVPSLYVGGLTLLLAGSAAGFRGRPQRAWLTALTLVGLAAALGEFGGPLWSARFLPGVADAVGPHDPPDVLTVRADGCFRDGDGGVYWLLATALPGFQAFRYPAKLLTFAALGAAGLAGFGWDRLAAGRSRRFVAGVAALAAISAACLGAALALGPRLLAAVLPTPGTAPLSVFGPLDPEAALVDVRKALAHGAVVGVVGLALAVLARRRAGLAGAAALLAAAVDLAIANAGLVTTAPQSAFDARPRALEAIEADARRDPSGPYRVHRLPLWSPPGWWARGSADRLVDFLRWERTTLQPKHGITEGVQYTLTEGTAEISDYRWFFGCRHRPADADVAPYLDGRSEGQFVYYSRRGYDLWNTRYFIVPWHSNGWDDEQRGYAAFLPHAEQVFPARDTLSGPDGAPLERDWADGQDYRILRNLDAYPRAWVVHRARFAPPLDAMTRPQRAKSMGDLLFQNDPLWRDPGRRVDDLRDLCWAEVRDREALEGRISGTPRDDAETVEVTTYGPTRVVLDARLNRPGLVVLADVAYPGWRLTIDGAVAPIYRVNRLMRGAAVSAGVHRLVYRYEPASFALGLRLSAAGLVAWLALACWARRSRPTTPGVGDMVSTG